MSIRGIQHVALPFPGTDEARTEARRFYGDALGLRELPVPEAIAPFVMWFQVGDQELHLVTEPPEVSADAESRRHPCLEVEGLQATRDQLLAAGVEIIESNAEISGRERFFVRDPFGSAIEIAASRPSGLT